MKEANFYPGPSRVYSNVTEYIYEAYMDGVMSINHRSEEFMQLMVETKNIMRDKLLIPTDYEIVFVSSATEAWEIVAQSLTQKTSQHFFNGAFGVKWASYAGELMPIVKTQFGINEELPTGLIADEADVLCVTQNETSNATRISMEKMQELRRAGGDKLIVADVTSSIGGIMIDYSTADIWYASVQKCLGLPAGLGIMILSPAAVALAYEIGENKRYNSMVRLLDNAKENQTSYTPNVLGIYLLNRTQAAGRGIEYISAKVKSRYEMYRDFFEDHPNISMLVSNEAVRSETVLALETSDVAAIKNMARDRGVVLGNGYGTWKNTSFRIANFPAIKTREIDKLMSIFRKEIR